ncbi:MAG: Kazal-type serine protease inhibitor domain-containing protein [Myxococcota bacterium]
MMTKRVAWLSVLVAAGCYDPKIEDGAFACGADDECPDGLECCDGDCYASCENVGGEGESEGEGEGESEAEAEGEGECEDACGSGGPPFCGDDGETYSNACVAGCAGIALGCPGECPCRIECGCGEIYAPVCGTDGQTYANPCEAKCAGVESCPGECPKNPKCIEKCIGDAAGCDPVCGIDGVTYPSRCVSECMRVPIACENPCEAGCAVEGESEGECGCDVGACPCGDGDVECNPVCALDGATYANAEQAACVGQTVLCYGECPCACGECSDEGPIVCTDLGPYPNACEAACDGIDSICVGDCSCGELGGYCEPMCGFNGVTYANTSQADCAGVGISCFGACPCGAEMFCANGVDDDGDGYTDCDDPDCGAACEGCACSDVWSPVCGGNGVTYSNTCEADCADVGVACPGECPCAEICGNGIDDDLDGLIDCADADCSDRPECGCLCPDIWSPVCGANGVTYSNTCEADCAGVGVVCTSTCPCGGECGLYPQSGCPSGEPGDGDGDGVVDPADNCPFIWNPAQGDSDGDGVGEYCEDSDTDADGNPDGVDPDLDGDGWGGDLTDNCRFFYNPDQADRDGNGWGDACDGAPMGCYVEPWDAPYCAPAGTMGAGGPCSAQINCSAGHFCTMSGSGVMHCAAFCYPGSTCSTDVVACQPADGLPEGVWACVYP